MGEEDWAVARKFIRGLPDHVVKHACECMGVEIPDDILARDTPRQ